MVKFRTSAHLQAALDDEIGWRLSELSNLRAAIFAAKDLRRTVLMRAAIPIAYAHWEGFIKRAASNYGIYLSSLGLKYKDLKPCFTGASVIRLVQTIGDIKRKVSTASKLLKEIETFSEQTVSIKLWPIVEDIGNLSYDMFEEVAELLGIDLQPYATKRNFIDTSLLASSNKIAHGERLDIGEEAIQTALEEVIGLMRMFKTDIENAITEHAYLR